MKKNRKNSYTKTTNLFKIIFLLVVFLGIGYAFLDATLNINGDVTVTAPELNVYIVNVGPADIQRATIVGNDKTEVDYIFNPSLTDNSYSDQFGITLQNKGSKDAYLESIEVKTYNSSGTEITLPSYLELKLLAGYGSCDGTESCGINPIIGNKIAISSSDIYRVTLRYVDDGTPNPTFEQITVKIKFNYTATTPALETDSWSTILTNITNNNTSMYHLGDTKTITIGTTDYKVRLVNNTTPAECSTTGFSQSACGFVFEFTDTINQQPFNQNGQTTGGWEQSFARTTTIANFYNTLPQDIKDVIISTDVISSYGTGDSSNFATQDNLYLSTPKEIIGNKIAQTEANNDTSNSYTRQLDFYNLLMANDFSVFAEYANSNLSLTRSVHPNGNQVFSIMNNGGIQAIPAQQASHIYPMFRVGPTNP